MSIENDVDNLLYGKKEPKISTKNKIIILIVMCSLGSIIAIPYFQRKEGNIDVQKILESTINKNRYGDGTGNSTLDNESAYNYWSAPKNSFGIKIKTFVNYSHFWKVFKKYSQWQLEAWHPVLEEWVSEWQGTNLNKWLNITRVRNSTTNASEKITLNVINNHPTQGLYFRFTFGIDLKVKSYVNKSSNYEYVLTYPANNTENYTVFFNFSDVKPLIQNGNLIAKHGITNKTGKELYYFRVAMNRSRNPLGAGEWYEIDPTFGDTSAGVGFDRTDNTIRGSVFQMGAVSGVADNITAYVSSYRSGEPDPQYRWKGCLYWASNDTKIPNGETDERLLDADPAAWYVFTYSAPKPNVHADVNYTLCMWTNETDGNDVAVIYADDNVGHDSFSRSYDYDGNGGTYPDPHGGGGLTHRYSIYCSYTVSAGGEDWHQTWSYNMSYSNSTMDHQLWTYNMSYSNTTKEHQVWSYNMSYSNTTNEHQTWSYNMSYSNRSKMYHQTWSYSMSYSNSSPVPITVYPGTFFDIKDGDERYGVLWVMNFSQIKINETWIMFNDTDWNITCANFVNITLAYIDEDTIHQVTDQAQVMWFWCNTTVGNINFNISGFNESATYYIMMNDTIHIGDIMSDADGHIEWNDNREGDRTYEIYKGIKPALGWNQTWSYNMSYSNTTKEHQVWTYNMSYSNTSMESQVWSYNMSYSNTTTDVQTWSYNMSYSNTSNEYQTWTYNMSYSNTSIDWVQQWTYNMSYSNSTPPLAYYQIWSYNMSYSNSTPPLFEITDEYPENQSFIYDLQPTVFFTLTHPDNKQMNYSVYIGNSFATCTELIANGENVTDGNYTGNEYYTAVDIATYYWKVAANDGNEWVNKSFYFTEDEMAIKETNWALLGLLSIFGIIAFIFIIRKRRE